MKDRVGLGWRPELAASILTNLGRVDVVEVVAEDWLHDGRALASLAAQVPVTIHGTSLGPAASAPVDRARVERLARLLDRARPESWSEHLAFVRGGGVEIGHLAAPPRTSETVDGAARNLALAARITGARPLVENVATLLDPPGSDMPEVEWLRAVVEASGCDLLLDLHNLHANAVNFGFDAGEAVERLPAERIRAIHLAGGKLWRGRILDDHLHDAPDEVFALLEAVAARAPGPLTVILERDGAFPPFPRLLAELDRARAALAAGRRSRELTRV
ncbi:MAG TPA: DUF692 family protein [Planctomycetota bacterium]